MTTSKTTIETLIDSTYDSIDGYRMAAGKAESPELKSILLEQAEKRTRTLDNLNNELVRLGGELITKGTATGSLHRLWVNITSLFESGDETAVERTEEGEDYLAKKFEQALEHADLDQATHAVIQSAYAEIKEGERLTDRLAKQYD